MKDHPLCSCWDEATQQKTHDPLCAIHGLSPDRTGPARGRAQAKRERQRRASRVNAQSRKQAYREGVLEGVKRERLAQQRRAYEDGRGNVMPLPYWCEWCGRGYQTYGDAHTQLHLHHHGTKRSLGRRASVDSYGDVDDPNTNVLVLACGGGCHRAHHDQVSGPRWSQHA